MPAGTNDYSADAAQAAAIRARDRAAQAAIMDKQSVRMAASDGRTTKVARADAERIRQMIEAGWSLLEPLEPVAPAVHVPPPTPQVPEPSAPVLNRPQKGTGLLPRELSRMARVDDAIEVLMELPDVRIRRNAAKIKEFVRRVRDGESIQTANRKSIKGAPRFAGGPGW